MRIYRVLLAAVVGGLASGSALAQTERAPFRPAPATTPVPAEAAAALAFDPFTLKTTEVNTEPAVIVLGTPPRPPYRPPPRSPYRPPPRPPFGLPPGPPN